MTDAGPGIIVGSNTLAEKVVVEYETGARLEVPVAKVKLVPAPPQSSVPPVASHIVLRAESEPLSVDKPGEDIKKLGA
jgi:hypothetical protein